VDELEEVAKKKAEIIGGVARRSFAALSRRPVTKIWVSGCDSRQEEEEALSLFLLYFEADCIPSKVCSEAAIQSGVKAIKRKSKQKGSIKRNKRRDRGQRSRMRSVESLLLRRYSVGLLRCRHSFGKETATGRERANTSKHKRERASTRERERAKNE
jgi:hypothetical protein